MANAASWAADAMSSMAEDLESWRVQHELVKVCWMFEDALIVANPLCEAVVKWVEELLSGERPRDNHSHFEEERLEPAMHQLRDASSRFLASMADFQEFEIAGAESFRAIHTRLEAVVKELDRLAAVEVRMGYRGVKVDPSAAGDLARFLGGDSVDLGGTSPFRQQIPLAD